MYKIRFTYKSSEVIPSVFLLLYFRMIGIYVYERFFDFGQEKQEHLLRCLPEEKEKRLFDLDDFELDLFLVTDKEDWEEYKNQDEYAYKDDSPHRIVVISYNIGIDLPYKANVGYYKELLWGKGQSKEALLTQIINQMVKMGILSTNTQTDWSYCQAIYQANNIWKLSLLGKYFYIAEDDDQYRNIRLQYKTTVNSIFQILDKDLYGRWKSPYIHLKYAALNMAYEGNLYCIRNNKTLLYEPQSLVFVCRDLINDKGANKLEKSFCLLLAQIHDDLLKDFNLAYKYYLPVCENYNAYAYYRKGNYWQEYAKDYKQALKYYIKSVYIYPEYYRAWYMLGCCYMLSGSYGEALDAFRNIGQILKPRLEAKIVRPMEIEYIFKAQNQCAFICNKALNNPQQSIRENFMAVEAWKAIDQSTFFDFISSDPDNTRKRVKNQLNVSKIYYEIYKLADKIGDAQLKLEYLDKIVKVI